MVVCGRVSSLCLSHRYMEGYGVGRMSLGCRSTTAYPFLPTIPLALGLLYGNALSHLYMEGYGVRKDVLSCSVMRYALGIGGLYP